MATAAAASSGTLPNVQGEKDAPPGLLPWVEKYRPVTLNDVVGNTEAIDRLKVVAQDGNMPHMLLAGPPVRLVARITTFSSSSHILSASLPPLQGTGKTSSIVCLSRELLGEEHLGASSLLSLPYSRPCKVFTPAFPFSFVLPLAISTGAAVLELNASDERGIDVIRSRIKMFAQKKVVLPPGRHKVVILDEADSMTSAAQQALRRTMEIYSHTTRFALACNTSSKIIEPIQSRCAILRFSRLADEILSLPVSLVKSSARTSRGKRVDSLPSRSSPAFPASPSPSIAQEILDRLRQICEAEHVGFSDDGLEAVIFTAEGDMRNAINNLQSTYSGFGYVNQANVFKVCDQPHPLLMKEVLDLCAGSGDLKAAQEKLLRVWNLGYSASDIVGTLFKVCRNHGTMNEGTKLNFIREIGMVHMRIAEGLNSRTQILGLLAKLCALQHKQQQQHENGKGQSN
ncbi:replication factor C subunit 2/4 [Nannochloropsis gaditana CCMP526]|uniref:replication factor C subunit 2/4 n=1 Tax=Nannochloropsis gaditana (strain CCMP526) TaxID=1093141 RepID=UPI00029F5B70|nr:replication factor C subunit 2/4 [Nannochloropsis gaditana CCMP526]EKU21354.1 replication factor C subunit 2/4 [Nannochloropsis gaditana CCMP526]|eukprot:XP_005855000.1 replication factor C subunit 2/4 [Nannochloropsis gaditana CCMP526]